MVLRLLLSDHFTHGIGGALYDQVCDRLIQRHLRLAPPVFAVTTATLYFPEAVNEPRACVSCVIQESHRLKHSLLGDEKMELVKGIDSLPARSPQRAVLFAQLHQKLDDAWRPVAPHWERQLHQTQQLEQEQRIRFDRELFYAIQPAQRLKRVIEHYANAFG